MNSQVDGIVQQMRERTRALHHQAERSGIVAALVRGKPTPAAYALYLRTLLPAYQTMECILRAGRKPVLAGIANRALYRAEAIESDLVEFAGAHWQDTLPLLDSGCRYAQRVESSAGGDGGLLLAHCYTRYLGDLLGGQVIGRRLAQLFDRSDWLRHFATFTEIQEPGRFASDFREALDQAGTLCASPALVVAEAEVAFRMNIAISVEVTTNVIQGVDKRRLSVPR